MHMHGTTRVLGTHDTVEVCTLAAHGMEAEQIFVAICTVSLVENLKNM